MDDIDTVDHTRHLRPLERSEPCVSSHTVCSRSLVPGPQCVGFLVFVCDRPQHYGKPFTSRRRFIKGTCKRAGVKEFGFHALRRYVASVLADTHKVSAKTIQRILRHKNLSTTEKLHPQHQPRSPCRGEPTFNKWPPSTKKVILRSL